MKPVFSRPQRPPPAAPLHRCVTVLLRLDQVRLSERNVVELVNKLKQLGLLGDELLHTTNGRECVCAWAALALFCPAPCVQRHLSCLLPRGPGRYITRERLAQEVRAAVDAAGGRLALVDLPSLLGVDLLHCEAAAAAVVEDGAGELLAAQGELFTSDYFDGVAAEVEELLQARGQHGGGATLGVKARAHSAGEWCSRCAPGGREARTACASLPSCRPLPASPQLLLPPPLPPPHPRHRRRRWAWPPWATWPAALRSPRSW